MERIYQQVIYLTSFFFFAFCVFIKIIHLLSVNSYLSKGMVEKLEVVNKKWVRVRLPSGNNVADGVS